MIRVNWKSEEFKLFHQVFLPRRRFSHFFCSTHVHFPQWIWGVKSFKPPQKKCTYSEPLFITLLSLFVFLIFFSLSFFSLLSDEFRSKVACENDIVQLECQPYFRIAIYSASYGRTEYESLQCPQRQGVPEESKLLSRFYFQ